MGPSNRDVKNRANIYIFLADQDDDASLKLATSYPDLGSPSLGPLPCSAQPHSTVVYDEQGRAGELTEWTITIRPSDLNGLALKRNDRFDILGPDLTTVTNSIYLNGEPRNGAGRGNALFATAREVR